MPVGPRNNETEEQRLVRQTRFDTLQEVEAHLKSLTFDPVGMPADYAATVALGFEDLRWHLDLWLGSRMLIIS